MQGQKSKGSAVEETKADGGAKIDWRKGNFLEAKQEREAEEK